MTKRNPVTLHLRSETKDLEHRSALSPEAVRELVNKGFTIHVERSPERIFDDAEFEAAGAKLVEEGSWPKAPLDHMCVLFAPFVLGIQPLSHLKALI